MKQLLWLMVFLFCLGLRPVAAKVWDPRLQQAVESSFAGQLGKAEVTLESYRRDFPEDPNGLIFWTLVQEWKAGLGPGNHEKVQVGNRKFLERALELAKARQNAKPEDVDALIDLGNSYFFLARNWAEQGKPMKAGLTGKKLEKPMREALAKDPSRKEAYLALGAFHYFADRTPKIFAPFKGILGIHGNKVEGLKELQKSLQGNHPFIWQARYALLEIYATSEEDFDQALNQLDPFEKKFPHNPVIPLKKARIYERNQPSEAIKIYLNLAEQCGQQFSPCPKKFPYFSYGEAGRLALQQGEPEKALPLFQQSLAIDPGDYSKRTDQIKKWQKKAESQIKKGESR